MYKGVEIELKQIFIEAKESLLKKKIFALLILVQATVFFFLLSVLFLHFNNVDTKTKSFYAQYEGKNIYQLSDELFNEKEQEYLSKDESLANLKNFYNTLNKSSDFKYLNTTTQPIGIVNFKGNKTFWEGYEDGSFPPHEIDGKKYEFVKSLQINKQVIDSFDLKLLEGNLFQKDDYIYNNNKSIPIILGSDYQSIYKIGDEVEIDYIMKSLKGRVVGILKPNSVLPVRENIEFYLDKHIILPSFSIEQAPINKDDSTFQKRHYLQLINGQIFTEKGSLQVRKLIDEISQSTNFYDLIIIGANDTGIDIMFSMLKQNINLLIMLTVLLFCFCVVTIFFSFIMKWNINIQKYAIHLISGATVYNILGYMFWEIFIIISISVIAVIISITFIGFMPIAYYFIIILTGLAITLSSILPLYIKLKKLNISNILKKKV